MPRPHPNSYSTATKRALFASFYFNSNIVATYFVELAQKRNMSLPRGS